MGTIRTVRDPHNLSHSRMTTFFGCPARAGYESFYENAKRTAVPYWLAGGGAVHHAIDRILVNSVAQGKRLPESRVDREVAQAKTHLWRVLRGELPSRGHADIKSRLDTIMWMSQEESDTLNPDEFAERAHERRVKYISTALPGIRAVALRCTLPSPFAIVKNGVRLERRVNLVSPRDPRITIPVLGEIDVLEQEMKTRRLIITDFKTGKFSYFLQEQLEANEQMLIYWHGVRELYKVDPIVAYFVSVNVYASDVKKFGPETLEQPQYKVLARIRYEEHFPELLNTMDDMWAVLNFLHKPAMTPDERTARDSWQPRSHMGKKFGLRRHVDEGRLIPSIGKHCGMCPERPRCKTDNPEDWEKYQALVKIGSVVDPPTNIPEEWFDPDQIPEEELLIADKKEEKPLHEGQFVLFGGGSPSNQSPLKRHTLTAKQWDGYGFFPPKRVVALMRRMHELIPLGPRGQVCPCKKTDRIPAFFLRGIMQFFTEREGHKLAQEAEGKTRGGEGKQRVKDLFDSENVRELLNDCPIPDCPFAKKTEAIAS